MRRQYKRHHVSFMRGREADALELLVEYVKFHRLRRFKPFDPGPMAGGRSVQVRSGDVWVTASEQWDVRTDETYRRLDILAAP